MDYVGKHRLSQEIAWFIFRVFVSPLPVLFVNHYFSCALKKTLQILSLHSEIYVLWSYDEKMHQ